MKKIQQFLFLKLFFIVYCFLISSCTVMKKNQHENANNELAEINVKMGLYYLIESKDAIKAKEKLLKASRQAPRLPAVWYGLGYFEENTGNIENAQKYYEHALRISPEDAASQNNYAAFLCRHGNYKKAIDYFLRAAGQPDYLNTSKAYQNAAQCAEQIPDDDLARKYYRLAEERGLKP